MLLTGAPIVKRREPRLPPNPTEIRDATRDGLSGTPFVAAHCQPRDCHRRGRRLPTAAQVDSLG